MALFAAEDAPAAPPRWCRAGVNLGGWLLCERWMQEGLFAAAPGATDEHALASALGPARAAATFARHRDTWLARDDFARIRAAGLDGVRLPVGWWVLDVDGLERAPYVGPCEDVVDRALDWAAAEGLAVNLCLHGAPGGQSGHDACGRADAAWTPARWDDDATVRCVARMAARFGAHRALAALTLVNEPSREIPAEKLVAFFERAYAAAAHAADAARAPGAAPLVVVAPVYQRRLAELAAGGRFPPAARARARFACDLHLYQCFGECWQRRALDDHLRRARDGRGHFPGVDEVPGPLVVSEWSLRLPEWEPRFPAGRALRDAPDPAAVYRRFAAAQLRQFAARGAGWYFWTWKVDAPSANGGAGEPWWDLRECLDRGWIDRAWLADRAALERSGVDA